MINLKNKTELGRWVATYLNTHNIELQYFAEYSGIDKRKMTRIMNGDSKLTDIDLFWIVECLADLTECDRIELIVLVSRIYFTRA